MISVINLTSCNSNIDRALNTTRCYPSRCDLISISELFNSVTVPMQPSCVTENCRAPLCVTVVTKDSQCHKVEGCGATKEL